MADGGGDRCGRRPPGTDNAKRVFGVYYAGMTLTVESAAMLNEQAREHFERRRFERRLLTENLAERQEP